jgi:hypothetical protein
VDFKTLPSQTTTPGNLRKEADIGASVPWGLVDRDYAPAPRNEHNRQGYPPCASLVGGGSNSLLSPPALVTYPISS